jgi:hypothetical protein
LTTTATGDQIAQIKGVLAIFASIVRKEMMPMASPPRGSGRRRP